MAQIQIKEYGKLVGLLTGALTIGASVVSLAFWTGKLDSSVAVARDNATKCMEKLGLYEPQIDKAMQFRKDASERLVAMDAKINKMDRNILILCIRSGVDCEKGDGR